MWLGVDEYSNDLIYDHKRSLTQVRKGKDQKISLFVLGAASVTGGANGLTMEDCLKYFSLRQSFFNDQVFC